MNDRELLELAAKAAKLPIIGPEQRGLAIFSEGCKGGYIWNPLDDDGDALRLAVSLNIDIYTPDGDGRVGALDAECNETWEPESNNVLRSVRRCIVRAAAFIGKDTP